ncbi:arrestin domain protein [Necator americanus]|uniref:Arrestin domain protein n=1 Tax=Necator americanus TaxID=51031 RepID=W2SP02_NECAM|nr:arrestin domain protein [Necator americanus]ETN70601.1 arrestin domain protein [Necator americanus]
MVRFARRVIAAGVSISNNPGSLNMLNVATSSSMKDNLTEFMIDLSRKDCCFSPGDTLHGRIHLKLSEGSIDITSLKITLTGLGRVNIKGKREESLQKSLIYMKKEWTIINSPTSLFEHERSYDFEDTLPESIPSSFYSSKGHVQYSIIAVLEYKNNDGEPSMVKAVRGITVIEELDLNKLSKTYFEPISEFEHRKFGWFSCFGGQIRLTLNIDRTAFVCGEGMSVVGRIENKSDRHVERVSASFQRIIRFGNYIEQNTENTLVDIQEMQEDILAMYVEEGASIKIDKKIHIPPVVPSTPSIGSHFRESQREEHGGRFHIRRKSHLLTGRLSISSQRSRTSLTSLPQIQRLMYISYKYSVRVKSGGVDIITIDVPIIIGSKPLVDTMSQDFSLRRDTNCTAVYKLCKHDRAIPLLDSKERTLCNKAQLQHLNKYPFFSDLSTSSKQSKKLGIIANTIRAENKVMNTILHSVMDERHTKSAASCSAVTVSGDSPDFIDTGSEPTHREEVAFTKLDPLFQRAFQRTPENSIDSPHPKILKVEDLL